MPGACFPRVTARPAAVIRPRQISPLHQRGAAQALHPGGCRRCSAGSERAHRVVLNRQTKPFPAGEPKRDVALWILIWRDRAKEFQRQRPVPRKDRPRARSAARTSSTIRRVLVPAYRIFLEDSERLRPGAFCALPGAIQTARLPRPGACAPRLRAVLRRFCLGRLACRSNR